jgi:hypothetical protein
MAWTDLSGAFGYGTQLTSTQMQNLRDNLTALAQGNSGAPEIWTEALEQGQILVEIWTEALEQGQILVLQENGEHIYQSVSGSWATSGTWKIYVPANAQNLYGGAWIYRGAQAGTVFGRISVGGQLSGNISNSTQTPTWVVFASGCDISGVTEGWTDLYLQSYHNAGAYAANITGLSLVFGD